MELNDPWPPPYTYGLVAIAFPAATIAASSTVTLADGPTVPIDGPPLLGVVWPPAVGGVGVVVGAVVGAVVVAAGSLSVGPGPRSSAARVPGPTTPSAFRPCAR